MGTHAKSKLCTAIGKELAYVKKQELSLSKEAMKKSLPIKDKISEKIPDKLEEKLKDAFCKAFEIMFTKGAGVLEKTYHKEAIENDYKIQNFTVDLVGSRKALKAFRRAGMKKQSMHTLAHAAGGVGLGVLGIGLPDIVGFIAVLLRGVFEICLQYGIDYEKPQEQFLILKMIEASLSKDKEYISRNAETDALLLQPVCTEALSVQIRKTAQVMAFDMLCLKFIQGIPVVGIIGGLGNPVYGNKILTYVRLKCYKRYLLHKINSL